jgi:2'-5' RNA ligase
VAPDLLHVTLAFLGDRAESDLPRLGEGASLVASDFERFHLALGDPGGFGPRSAPRVLWVGLAGESVRLGLLQQELADHLRKAGVTLEDRPFAPHLTLARRQPNARLSERLAWPTARPSSRSFLVERFVLIHSVLSSAGPSYTVVGAYSLAPRQSR